MDDNIEVKNGITTVQKRDLLKIIGIAKDIINNDEFLGICLICQRAIDRVEKEANIEL